MEERRGVGISSAGNINASGIITATTFSGAFSGNLTGVVASTTQLQTARSIGGVLCNTVHLILDGHTQIV